MTDIYQSSDQAGAAAPEPSGIDPMGEESRRLAAYWKDQLDRTKDEYKKWEKRGRTIEKRYRDERARMDAAGEDGAKRYAALWSNVQTLLPALYGRVPVPVAERRFRDKDPVGRGAAQILERALRNEVEINGYDEVVNQVVLDYLLPARGVAWVRYEPKFGQGVSLPVESDMDLRDSRGDIEADVDSPVEVKLDQTADRVIRESVPVDYVPWGDFFTMPAKARTWREVVAVAKRVYPTRDQMKQRFGESIGKRVPLQQDDRDRRRQRDSVVPGDEADQTAEVYEIWSRSDQKVYWIAEGYEYLLDVQSDPLELENFFPVPRPLYANTTNNTLVPVADYMHYQDQAIQIDELVNRISTLTKACKVAGVYNAAAKDIQRLLDETVENELIPVDSWAAFADKGGVAGQISLLPLKEIIGVINELNGQLDRTIAQMDRLTGITDIMRGTGDARETLGGQRLKSNNGGTRINRRQANVARFCRDLVRLIADVMCRHFSPESLIEASGALYEEGLGASEPMLPIANGPSPLTPPLPQSVAGAAPPPPVGAAPTFGVTPLGGVPNSPLPEIPGAMPGMPAGQPMPSQPASDMAGPPAGANVVPFPGGAPQPQGMLGMQPPQVPPEVQAKIDGLKRILDSIELLRNERLRGFRVDIEVDSTIFGDAQQEKADRVEFITSITKYLQTAVLIGQQDSTMIPLLGKLLQFGVRGFRVGRDLEAAIEDFCDDAEVAVKRREANPQAAPPDPAQLQAQREQQRGQVEMAKAGEKMKQLQLKTQSDAMKSQAEVARQQVENQGESYNSQMDLESKRADERMRTMEMQMEHIRLQIELAKLQAAQKTAEMQVKAAESKPDPKPKSEAAA